MKYKKFSDITEYWSDNDVVCFLMEYPDWNASVLEHIMKEWSDLIPIEIEEIIWFAKENGSLKYTKMPEEDE